MRRHLASRGIGDDIAEAAIAELGRQGYVDDARFAARFAEDRRALDGWGSERIERRLRELGVPEEHVAAAAGVSLITVTDAAIEAPLQAALRLRLPVEALHLFDVDSGVALTHGRAAA